MPTELDLLQNKIMKLKQTMEKTDRKDPRYKAMRKELNILNKKQNIMIKELYEEADFLASAYDQLLN